MKIGKYDIRFNTFTKKGLPRIDDRFGVYFVTGRQGSGKTYYAIYLALQQVNFNNEKAKIKTNIKSLNIPGAEIEYFEKVEEIYFDNEEKCIFILDEIARKWSKGSKTDTQFYAFLNQCRKMKRICIMITQEWKELPMWIRRPAKFMITTRTFPVLSLFNLYVSIVGDAENMVLDPIEMEWVCPPLKYIVYKRTKEIASYYDTFEAINML